MSKKTGGVLAVVGMCALSVVLLNCGSSSSRPSGLLYVISQSESNVSSFTINLDNGGLSLVNSNATTCTTLTGSNPVSCGLPVGMLLDPTKATAFVLNQGLASSSPPIPPTIYGYTVNSDGSLSTPTASATLPAGDTSVAMTADAAGDLLFVIDQGLAQSPNDCPGGTDCPSIQVFSTTPGSTTVTPASVFSLNRIPTSLSVLTFTPPNTSNTQTLLFMTSDMDLSGAHIDNELSVYSVDSSGTLTEQPNSPYTTAPTPNVVLAVNTNVAPQTSGGVFVYVGTQGSVSGSVSAFVVCTVQGNNGCSITQASNNQLLPDGNPSGAGQNPWAMLVDPTNSFLYVASKDSNQVFGYLISTGTGTLSPLSPASKQVGATPLALALHGNFNGSGEFLYTSNNSSSSISEIGIDATTGAMGDPNSILFTPGLPYGIAAK